jgi:hypothetical protein
MVQYQRAVYRDNKDFRTDIANITPLWAGGLAGVCSLYFSVNALIDRANLCLPETAWSTPGVMILGLGLALAMTAIVRLIVARVRIGKGAESAVSQDGDSSPHHSAGTNTSDIRKPNLPPERRRAIVEYTVTYGTAVVLILVGAGIA